MKKTVLWRCAPPPLGLGACKLEVPDLNDPSLESLRRRPRRPPCTRPPRAC